MHTAELTLSVIPVRHLQPHDVIVCQHAGTLTAHQAATIKSKIKDKFPGFKILVQDSRTTLEILRPLTSAL
jgi:hypothetical protein